MEYARSLKDGTEYRAIAVSYDKAKALDLTCPVCGAKVFKRVRWTPEENHCFVHHKGGSRDCELYHPGADTLTRAAFDAMARGQDFQLFVKQVDQSIEGLLTKTRVVVSIHRSRLESFRKAIASMYFKMDDESFDHVEERAISHLGEAGLISNVRVSRILDAKLRFYRHPQARFIDKSITSWLLYGLATKHSQANVTKLVEVMTTNTVDLERTAGLIFAGLAARDAKVGISWFSWDFDKLLSAQERQIPKSVLKHSNRRPEALTQPASPPNPVLERYELDKQKLIKIGYRFHSIGWFEVAVAPDGRRTTIFPSFFLEDLLKAATEGSKVSANRAIGAVTSQSKPMQEPDFPAAKIQTIQAVAIEREKMLRDLQDFGWTVSHNGFKWNFSKKDEGSYDAWTTEDLKRFWLSNKPS